MTDVSARLGGTNKPPQAARSRGGRISHPRPAPTKALLGFRVQENEPLAVSQPLPPRTQQLLVSAAALSQHPAGARGARRRKARRARPGDGARAWGEGKQERKLNPANEPGQNFCSLGALKNKGGFGPLSDALKFPGARSPRR